MSRGSVEKAEKVLTSSLAPRRLVRWANTLRRNLLSALITKSSKSKPPMFATHFNSTVKWIESVHENCRISTNFHIAHSFEASTLTCSFPFSPQTKLISPSALKSSIFHVSCVHVSAFHIYFTFYHMATSSRNIEETPRKIKFHKKKINEKERSQQQSHATTSDEREWGKQERKFFSCLVLLCCCYEITVEKPSKLHEKKKKSSFNLTQENGGGNSIFKS